ncbi:hypothetical protein NQ315_008827 [Exocentrus adspersus]|uniref:DDE Tnp4 domain-containing protein n=1 Tax=Exocentrus adspersus TaxID=1586481 RepID=A0AAV8VC02_9CUCU|nr:hypothetical protein NQ315_008827 [Exocentrus adspersus]
MAYFLVNEFQNSIFFQQLKGHGGSPFSPAEAHILSFIWFARNKCCLRDVAERQITRVMEFLVHVAPQYIMFPKSENEKLVMAQKFEEISGFPGILGCIDGTSITVKTSAHKIKSTYVNRHDIPSVTLQGICDYKRRFTDVFTGPPGKLPNICAPNFHIIGDSAYNLKEYLLVPFRDYRNLNAAQENFNYKLSASRVLIENTFGILKSRFRQLTQLEFHEVDKITKFIISCCVLHNVCIDFEDFVTADLVAHVNHAPEIEMEVAARRLGLLWDYYVVSNITNWALTKCHSTEIMYYVTVEFQCALLFPSRCL